MLLGCGLVGGVVVDLYGVLLCRARLGEILASRLLFFRPVLEIASFAEFGLCISVVIIVVPFLNLNLPLIFGLIYSLLGIDGWETYILGFRIESEEWNIPITLFIIPLGSLVQFVKLIFGQKNTHNFVAKLNGFFLRPYNIK
jgi:hypothetical protein